MALPNDQPDGLPPHTHEDLLVNFGSMDCYTEIENDEGGKTPNTDKYTGRFGVALASLSGFVGPPDAKPRHYEYDEGDFL